MGGVLLFLFKQKTAYEVRISDGSSDVCASDLAGVWDAVQTYHEDIVYLSIQHMELVAISSLLALAVAIPLGIWISRPSQHRFTQPILQLLNIGRSEERRVGQECDSPCSSRW